MLNKLETLYTAAKLYKEYNDELHRKLLERAKVALRRSLRDVTAEDYTVVLDMIREDGVVDWHDLII